MRIAIPLAGGQLSPHFGHCEEFALIEVDHEAKSILSNSRVAAPPHAPGMLPGWLAGQEVNVVIAGGMGGRAIEMFQQASIQVVQGAPVAGPSELAQAYLDGRLSAGANTCDHGSHGCRH